MFYICLRTVIVFLYHSLIPTPVSCYSFLINRSSCVHLSIRCLCVHINFPHQSQFSCAHSDISVFRLLTPRNGEAIPRVTQSSWTVPHFRLLTNFQPNIHLEIHPVDEFHDIVVSHQFSFAVYLFFCPLFSSVCSCSQCFNDQDDFSSPTPSPFHSSFIQFIVLFSGDAKR